MDVFHIGLFLLLLVLSNVGKYVEKINVARGAMPEKRDHKYVT